MIKMGKIKEKIIIGLYPLILVGFCIVYGIHQKHLDDIANRRIMSEPSINPKYKELSPNFYVYISDKEITKINDKEQLVTVRIKIMNTGDPFIVSAFDQNLSDSEGNSYKPDHSKVYYDEYVVDKNGIYNKMLVYKIPATAKPKEINGSFVKDQHKLYFNIDLNNAY